MPFTSRDFDLLIVPPCIFNNIATYVRKYVCMYIHMYVYMYRDINTYICTYVLYVAFWRTL